MSDPADTRPKAHPGAPPGSPPTGEGDRMRTPGETARGEAQAARDAASRAASDIGAEAQAAAQTLKREGAALLDEAKDRATHFAEEGKQAGAERAEGVARAIHRAAEELESESPALARTIHDAAGAVDGMARAIRERSFGEMLRGAEDFARRQPLVFFGAAALAGFAVTRFARASATHHHAQAERHPGMPPRPGATMASTRAEYPRAAAMPGTAAPMPGHVTGEDGTPRPATLASASLGGAAAYRPPGQENKA